MTVPRRQSRAITVDGIALRWWYRLPSCRVQDCPQDWAHVLIAGASRAGAVVSCAIETGSGPATPARVAAAARVALARGWVPDEGSGEMHLRLPRVDEVNEADRRCERRGRPRVRSDRAGSQPRTDVAGSPR